MVVTEEGTTVATCVGSPFTFDCMTSILVSAGGGGRFCVLGLGRPSDAYLQVQLSRAR